MIRRYLNQIERLLDEHPNVRWSPIQRWDYSAVDITAVEGERGTIAFPLPTNRKNYVAALHEIGHLHTSQNYDERHANGEQADLEAEAWLWAFDHLDAQKDGPYPEDVAFANEMVSTYLPPNWFYITRPYEGYSLKTLRRWQP